MTIFALSQLYYNNSENKIKINDEARNSEFREFRWTNENINRLLGNVCDGCKIIEQSSASKVTERLYNLLLMSSVANDDCLACLNGKFKSVNQETNYYCDISSF